MSSKKNQACCRAPSLTLPLLTTHCRASSSWKSWEQEGTISKPFTIKHTAYRSLRLSSSEGDKMVLWHNVHCEAARVGRIHYSTDQTLNKKKQNSPIEHRVFHTTSDTSFPLHTVFRWHSKEDLVPNIHKNMTTTATKQQQQQQHPVIPRQTGAGEERVGSCSPGIGSLPFWSASVLLMFARNWRSQCAMTCDCHCAPWPTGGDEWKGDNRLVWRTGVCDAIH